MIFMIMVGHNYGINELLVMIPFDPLTKIDK